MKIEKTGRGFSLIQFTDKYNVKCSLQESSLATEDCIWLGVDDVEPKIMVKDAVALGLDTNGQTDGCISYSIPEKVVLSSRMHLTQQQVLDLLPHLLHFAIHGTIER